MPLLNKRILNKFYAKSEHFKNEPKFHELKKYFEEINSRIEKKDFGNESSERQEFISSFLKILGYKFNDNFWFENTTMNGRSIDACIGTNVDNIKKVEVAIEWKGVDTKHLDKKVNAREESPVSQMWDYMGKEAAHIGIVSNFEEIRIYSLNKGQVEYQLYTLKNLVNDDKLLIEFYSLLRFDMLLKANNNISKFEELVISSDAEQELITKEFYRDYKQCRIALYSHLVENNIIDKNTLLEKTQKILDRLIFIMFCEDSPAFLINSGTIRNNYNDVMKSFTNDDQKVWISFKGLFEYIDKGNDYHGINAFNGGLFAKDSELDNLVIKNDIWKQLTALSEYDFASDLDVNILGHIFEQSIADIENIKNEINGIEPKKKKKTIRNKDGIFYTPEYITEYIVENTIGEWLKENPEGLDSIKVLDPAGGSGAFLNQAHTYLAKAQAEALNQKIALDGFDNLADQDAYSIDKSILNNNLYMVDLQPESVEIAKLSLWLKTASKQHKLNNLDANIKCGNSLIDDPQVAGIRAFKWNQEFPTVMENGGFDVIIGNPPWGAEFDLSTKSYISINYLSAEYQIESYVIFIEKGLKLLKENGYMSFIIPSTWLNMNFFQKIRKILIEKTILTKLDLFTYQVFEDVTAETSIFVIKKSKTALLSTIKLNIINNSNELKIKNNSEILQSRWQNNYTNGFNPYFNEQMFIEMKKILISHKPLSHYVNFSVGIKPYQIGKGKPKQTETDVLNRIYDSKSKLNEEYVKYIVGSDFNRFKINNFENKWIKYGVHLAEPRKFNFKNDKIIIRQTSDNIKATLDCNGYYNLNNVHNLILKPESGIQLKYILGILNSNKIDNIYKFLTPEEGRVFAEVKINTLKKLPIPFTNLTNQNKLIQLVDEILKLNIDNTKIILNFTNLINAKYAPKIESRILKLFYKLDFSEFLSELKKQKVIIETLTAESELLQYFEQEKKKIIDLQVQIEQVDNEIEALVVQLYGLEGIDLEI
jgi:N-6 DNA Methylase/TaqI-like C-terminal specificity domain